MDTRAKLGLTLVIAGLALGLAGVVLAYKDYIDAVYAETGWHPSAVLLIAPALGAIVFSAGVIALATRSATASS